MLLFIKDPKDTIRKATMANVYFQQSHSIQNSHKKSIISYVQTANIFIKKSRKQYTSQYPQRQKA